METITTEPKDLITLNSGRRIDPEEVEDVIFGCANPEGANGMNIARMSALKAGLPVTCLGGGDVVRVGRQDLRVAVEEEVGGVCADEVRISHPSGGGALSGSTHGLRVGVDAEDGLGDAAVKIGLCHQKASRLSVASTP